MDRHRAIVRVLWVVLFLNWAVAAAKLVIGYGIDSLGMIADGFHSLLDGSSNVIGLVGMVAASRPPDADHHYGHHKYEAVSALGIALLLGVTAIEVVQAGIGRLTSDLHPKPSLAGLAVMAVTMAVNAFVTRYEYRRGVALQSQILVADSAHTRSDILVSLSVLAGLGAVWLGLYWVDVAVAFLIAAFILYVAYGLFCRVSQVLTDAASLDPAAIAAVAREEPEVISTSTIRTRGAAPSLFIDLDIQLDPDLSLADAHRIAHGVRDRCMRAFGATDVVVHVEPAPPSAGASRMAR
ncbi:MAG: cation transporter [Candidatus Lambdaproteobacteria bacterium]|nr:cation transporter [Candidatus Lambdaproteobacteria bacterium]